MNTIRSLRAEASGSTAKPLADFDHPWLGLLAFNEETKDFFFGREKEVREIYQRATGLKTLTVLYGPSGLGKTSLLQVGLIPVLRKSGFLPVLIRLRYESPQRAEDWPAPAEQVRAALAASLQAFGQPALANACTGGRELWALFHDTQAGFLSVSAPKIVLLFDQFEELYTHGERTPETSRAWLEELADLVENRPSTTLAHRIEQEPTLAEQFDFVARPVKVVLVLRDDSLSRLERSRRAMPSLMENRMELRLLTGPQALEAVVKPGRRGGRNLVSNRVGEKIVCFVANVPDDTPLEKIEAVPPLVSLMCERLNAARPKDGQITEEMVSSQGKDILQKFYDESFAGMPKAVREYVENHRRREGEANVRANEALEKQKRAEKLLAVEERRCKQLRALFLV
jgi:hypothetical protein